MTIELVGGPHCGEKFRVDGDPLYWMMPRPLTCASVSLHEETPFRPWPTEQYRRSHRNKNIYYHSSIGLR